MVELTFKSAGVSTREIDLTGPAAVVPIGIPAGIIGTAEQGPAFVPVTMANINQFRLKFGESGNAGKFGPLAVSEWLRNAQAVTYLRVLGVGLGEKRTTSGNNAGRVESAGFVVGAQLPDADGSPDVNEYANAGGALGRVHFLGCYMSESAGSTIFSRSGRQSSGVPAPILRGVIFAPSGVVPTLAASTNASPPLASTVGASPLGSITGTVVLSQNSIAKQEFVMFLNGHIGADSKYPRVLTASFDVTAPNYFGNVLNTDPALIQQAGHYLYTRYDIHPAFAAVTGSALLSASLSTTAQNIAFLTTGALARNSGSATAPSFENFEDRFRTPKTPYFISQRFGGKNLNLFRIHALADGAYSNTRIKISIDSVAKSNTETDRYGTFNVVVRDFYDTDESQVVLERFSGLSLNPRSDRYIARIIGDLHLYFDFDKNVGSQKLRQDGLFPNRSNYIRVEMDRAVEDEEVDATALPIGFRGPAHLVLSGTAPLATNTIDTNQHQVASGYGFLNNVAEPPVPYRQSLANGSGVKKDPNSSLYWGVQFELADDVAEPNKGKRKDKTIESLTKYFPNFASSWQSVLAENNSGTVDTSANGVIDADRYNANLFSLERIRVVTGSDGLASTKFLQNWEYVRNGVISTDASTQTRAFSADTDLASLAVRNVAKYTVYLQGGFDGVNIFDTDAAAFNDRAVKEEMDYPARGQNDGPTVRAYLKALELMGNTAEVDVKLMSIPGIRHEVITDEVINTTEARFDAMAVLDIEERDVLNNVVTSSAEQQIGVGNTANAFSLRGLDTSFAAAYFPDVVIVDPFSNLETRVPPSVAALGALSLNDSIARPWNAPAGIKRGALETTIDATVKLSRQNMDDLYEVDINPIVSFPGSDGVVVWGQKTLLRDQSALDRINVRRLLIEVRREVRQVTNSLLFEPNRAETLARFSALVGPVLKRIQDQQGLDGFKVVIDASTTSEADVENNTLRGKIFLVPTRTAEFIDLDFVLTNTGGFAAA